MVRSTDVLMQPSESFVHARTIFLTFEIHCFMVSHDDGGIAMKYLFSFLAMLLLAPANATAADSGFEERIANSWEIAIGAIYLHREAGENRVLMQDAGDPTRNLSTDSFGDLDSSGAIGTLNGDIFGTGFEFRGILTDTASESANAIVGAPTLVRINSFVPFFLPGVTSITGVRETTFDSAEANINLLAGENWRFFAGGRAMWIDDDMNLTLNAAVLPSTFVQNVSNQMIGPQIGVEVVLQELLIPHMEVSASARLAFMQSDVEFNSVLDTGVVVVAAAGSADQDTPVLELEAIATFNINPNFAIEFGYNYIYIQDIATSPASVANTNYFTGVIGGTSLISGDSFQSAHYHGATVKAVLRY